MKSSTKLLLLATVLILAMPTESRAYNWMAICVDNKGCYKRQCFPPNPSFYQMMEWCRQACPTYGFITDSVESANCGGTLNNRPAVPRGGSPPKP